MATLEPGTYEIFTQLPNQQPAWLAPSPTLPVINAVLAGGPFAGPVPWKVAAAGNPESRLFTLRLGFDNSPVIVQSRTNGELLFVDTSNQTPPTPFSITSAGDKPQVWTVQLPAQNSVWTLDKSGNQIKLTGASGLAGQKWTFVRVD